MDLHEARAVVSRSYRVPGQSDNALVTKVAGTKNFTLPAKALQPASGLAAGTTIRPIEALHYLAYVTRALYQDDVYDRYVHWALLRYLGFFDQGPSSPAGVSSLRVSQAGRRIAGNQRRLASEEMGIGFGCLLAARWFAHDLGSPGIPVSFVDIDVALRDGFVMAGGSKKVVSTLQTQIGSKRPDYLMLAPDKLTGRYRARAVECKGTSTPGYGLPQLAGALHQLEGVTLDGRVPPGVAVCTITPNKGDVRYLAIDPADRDEPTFDVGVDDNAYDVILPAINEPVEGRRLVDTALRSSWATLADFGGNTDAVRRWAPRLMSERLVRRPRERGLVATPAGVVNGSTSTFRFDGTTMAVTYGIASDVDAALSSGQGRRVRDAQIEFASSAASWNADTAVGSNLAMSATSDGSVFVLSVD